MKRRVAQFESEAAMCAYYVAIATGKLNGYGRPWRSGVGKNTGWLAYPETAGWDLLMVREKDGFQVGIQAKLRLNDAVIQQAIEDGSSWSACSPGPDCRAVLVPHGSGSDLYRLICRRAGIQVITIRNGDSDDVGNRHPQVEPDLPDSDYADERWAQMLPTERARLPPFVPDSIAGSSSPLTLTAWKIKAIKIACILERRGWVCRQDFKHIQIDHRRFIDSGWLVAVDGAWRRGPAWPDFRGQHPRNFGDIDALYEDWKPPELPLQQQASFGRLL